MASPSEAELPIGEDRERMDPRGKGQGTPNAEVARVIVPGGRFVGLEMRSMDTGSWPRWQARLAHRLMRVCTVDGSHRSLEAILHAFGDVKVRPYWAGMLYVAVATKARVGSAWPS